MMLEENDNDYYVHKLIEYRYDKMEFIAICRDIPDYEFWNIMNDFRKEMRNRNIKTYYYLVTFTISPDIEDNQIDDIQSYIISQFENRPALHICEAYICKEYTKELRPHWHVAVSTHKSLKKDRFNWYQKKYGFVDVSKSKIKSLDESINYIAKEGIPMKLDIKVVD